MAELPGSTVRVDATVSNQITFEARRGHASPLPDIWLPP